MAIQIPYTDAFITPEGGSNFESQNNKGQVNGYAPLDVNAKVPLANLPDEASLGTELGPEFDGKITTHNSETTSVHGIANTANLVLTNDSRLSNSRTPTTHTHAIADVTGLQTAIDGKQASGSYAPASGISPSAVTGTAVVTSDARLSDSRTPTAHSHDDRYYTETEIDTKLSGLQVGGHTHDDRYYTETEMDTLLNGKQASGSYAPSTGIAPSAITGTAVVTNDSRLSDNRTPTAHKSSHATGGTDALTPSDIGASATEHTHAISDVTGLQTAIDNIDNSGIKAGVQWTNRHTTSTGNPYLVGSIVYDNGRVYRCIAQNDSIPPQQGGNQYWADLGVGYLLPNENPKIEGGSINTSTFLQPDETSGAFYSRNTQLFYLALSGSFNLKPTYDFNDGEYLLRYAGGSWFIEQEGQAIATAVAGDEPYPWLATWPSGTSITKEHNRAGGSINASGGSGGGGGTINLSNGGGSITIQNSGGSIQLSGVVDDEDGNSNGGSIDLRALGPSNSNGGSIISRGGEGGQGATGGTLNMSASGEYNGGSINLTAGANGAGGSINTSNGGGSINTTFGGGSINTSGIIKDSDGETSYGGSINTSGGQNDNGGSINTSNGGGSINTSNGGGSINTSGGVPFPYPEEIDSGNGLGATGGSIDLRGGNGGQDGSSGVGGSIQMKGASGDDGIGGAGGSILMNGAIHDGHSGSINLSARPDANGGSINLSAGASGPYTSGAGGSITSIGSAGTDPGTGQPPDIYAGGSLIMSAGASGAGGSINTSNGGGSINTSGGSKGDVRNGGVGGAGGSINLSGGDDDGSNGSNGGSISLAGGTDNCSAGSIISNGGTGTNAYGGTLNMSGGSDCNGGSINTSGGANGAGGSINTSNGGGSIDTNAGYIQLGVQGIIQSYSYVSRIVISGTSNPNVNGTYVATTVPSPDEGIGLLPYSLLDPSGKRIAWGAEDFILQETEGGPIRFTGSADGVSWDAYEPQATSITVSGIIGEFNIANGTYNWDANDERFYGPNTCVIMGNELYSHNGDFSTPIATNSNGYQGAWTPSTFINQVTISNAGTSSVNGVYTRTSSGVYGRNSFSGPASLNWVGSEWDLGGESYASGNLTSWTIFNTGLPQPPTASVAYAQHQLGSPSSTVVVFPTGSISGSATTTAATANLGNGARTTIQSGLTSSDIDTTLTLPRQSGTIALTNDARFNSFTIAVPNVDIGKTVSSNPNGWSQQVTIPANIAELTGGLPCLLDSVGLLITNRLGTGTLHLSATFAGGLRVGSQSALALTPFNGVSTYNADNYFTSVFTGVRPWTGGYTKVFTSGGTFGRSLYNGGAIFLNNSVTSGLFRTEYFNTPLTEAMDATQTTLLQSAVSGATSYEGTYLKIDNEVVLITSWPTASGNRPTILRAQLGTTATTHAIGASATANLGSALGGGILATVYLNFIRVA